MNDNIKKLLDSNIIPKYLIPLLRIIFGLLFIFSGFTKIINVNDFQDAIMKFAVIPDYYVEYVSYAICLLEIFIGVCITFNLFTIIMLQIIIFILALFTSVLVVQLVQGGDVSCGCLGDLSSDKIDLGTVLRNVLLIAWAFLLFYIYLKYKFASNSKEKFKERVKSSLIISCFIFFIVSNTALAIRNIELKNRVTRLLDDEVLLEGETVKPFEVFKIDGSKEIIDYANYDKIVLFILKFGCQACDNSVENWNEINKRIKNKKVKIIGVSVNDLITTQNMINQYNVKFELVYNSSKTFRDNFKIIQTPNTIIIGQDGMVENLWTGAISSELLSFFDKKLNHN